MKIKNKFINTLWVVFVVVWLSLPIQVGASNSEYQRCKTGDSCVIGEFLYDDDYAPISTATCTLTSRYPNGTLFLNAVSLTGNSDGWYSYSVTTSGETEGLYRSQVCCTSGADYLCLDKSFYIGPSFLSEDNVSDAVWNKATSGYTVAGTFGKNLQNPTLLASEVWGYSTKELTGFGNLVEQIWSYSTRELTNFGSLVANVWNNATRTLTGANLSSGSLATVNDIQVATSSAVISIKGSSNKDLTQISSEVAGVQTTVNSIENKINTLNTNVNTIDSNVDTIIAKWSSYSMSDVIGYVDQIETRLGENNDTCANEDTVFGNVQCVRDKWGSQTADNIYLAANNAATTSASLQTELGYNGKTDSAYDDIQSLKTYVDTLETLVGTSSDISSSTTLFGRIKKVQETTDSLNSIESDIDDVLAKWNSYDAEDIYNKVKDLSSEISAINAVTNISSILSLATTNETDVDNLLNKTLAMKAVVDVNYLLLERVSNQPIIQNWLEEGSIVFKTLITNPSKIASQTVPLKYFLPREVKKEDIIKVESGLTVDYDATENALYVHGKFNLAPERTKTFSVEVADIWQISEDEIKSLREQTNELIEPLKNTTYFAQGITIKSDIHVSLNKVLQLQKNAYTPEARIIAYRNAVIEMEGARNKLESMKTLVTSAGSMGTMFGFVGGVQTLAVWGLIIVLIAGFVFLALYMQTLKLREGHIATKIEPEKRTNEITIKKAETGFGKTVKNLKKRLLKIINVKSFVAIWIVLLVAGTVVLGASFFRRGNLPNLTRNYSDSPEQISPNPSPSNAPTPTLIPKKVRVVGNSVNYLNVREGPGVEFDKIATVDIGKEFVELKRKENDIGEEWVKIKINNPSSNSEQEGWVLEKYVVVSQESKQGGQEKDNDEIELTDERQVLGTEDDENSEEMIVIVPAGANGVNIRKMPSYDSEILTHFWTTTRVNKLGEVDNWVKIEVEVKKEGKKYTEGWVASQLTEEIKK